MKNKNCFLYMLVIIISLLDIKSKLLKYVSFLQLKMKYSKFKTSLSEYGSVKINFDKLSKEENTLFAYYDKKGNTIELVTKKKSDKDNKLVAYGKYKRSRFETGWDEFESETYNKGNPIIQCYSVGLIEGILSQKEIKYYLNNFNYFINEEEKKSLKNWFSKLDEQIKQKINDTSNTENKDYENYDIKKISYMSCIHAQLTGVYSGYNAMSDEKDKIDISDLYVLNSEGNYDYALSYLKINELDINSKEDFFKEENLKLFYNTSRIENIWKKLLFQSHCSAIVKYIKYENGTNDLYFGHNTWTGYNELLRIFKKINYEFEGDETKDQIIGMKPIKMRFSSYPGILYSGDDFYQIENNLAISQTSTSVINMFQYKNSVDIEEYIPEFMRILMVNYLSRSGKEWVDNYHSINKNNHLFCASWIVVDYNYLNEKENLIYIIDDLPGIVKSTDYTDTLKKKGYYGSFNLPFFRDNSGKIGLDMFNDTDFYGSIYFNPRQYIINYYMPKVKNLGEFKDLLMYNKYNQNSELRDDPSITDKNSGLASRGSTNGAIDFKIVNKYLMDKETVWIYSGTIYGEGEFEPFTTKEAPEELKPYLKGVPKKFEFKPYLFK